jgi:hypothetical protein
MFNSQLCKRHGPKHGHSYERTTVLGSSYSLLRHLHYLPAAARLLDAAIPYCEILGCQCDNMGGNCVQ